MLESNDQSININWKSMNSVRSEWKLNPLCGNAYTYTQYPKNNNKNKKYQQTEYKSAERNAQN